MATTNASVAKFAQNMRISALNMVHYGKASHIGSALSICDIVATLYSKVMNVNPASPDWPDRDRFILSKGHACVAVYAALAELGFIEKSTLTSYGQDHSFLMNHISHKVLGVEFSTGALGHGLSFGVGKALSAKMMNSMWKTFVLMSDGEIAEGSNWEALMFAAHHNLDNLTAIVDYNKLQSLTTVEKTLGIEPLADKFRAFGWSVREVDGHDVDSLENALCAVPWSSGKPSLLIAHTTKGKGVSFMEDSVDWHYKSPNSDQLNEAISEIKEAHNA
jgi:transketolase